ncbi:DMT family transporter [Oleomonas cavernae]|uniref:DMT family transporter n=1 Tax=Oleomonas cavernae TaxID=2320859 RepID=A0A418WTD6_9PROT|nr:DMT family transporter [Oleomonas cavernae]RJF94436.1 DMT family transporter [Oleomonas cavernae]
MAPIDIALVLLVNLAWGFNFVAAKVAVNELPPMLLTGLRFCLLGLMLAPLIPRVPRDQIKAVLLVTVFAGILHFGLLFIGLGLVDDVSSAAVAIQLNIPFVTILSVVILKETIRWRRILGIVLAFAGVFVIGFDPRVFSYVDGLLLCVSAAFAMAIAMIIMRRMKGVGVFTLQAWMGLVTGPAMILISLLFETGQVTAIEHATWIGWGGLAFTIFGSSLIGHAGNFRLLQRYPVTLTAPMMLLAPVLGIFFGVTMLGDAFTTRMIIGSAMTLAGVGIIMLREKKILGDAP